MGSVLEELGSLSPADKPAAGASSTLLSFFQRGRGLVFWKTTSFARGNVNLQSKNNHCTSQFELHQLSSLEATVHYPNL